MNIELLNKIISLFFGILSVFLPQFGKISLLYILAGLLFGGLALYNIKGIEERAWVITIMIISIFGIYRCIAFFVLFSTRAVN
ncbi:hypothetical protein [Desulfitibacter alkalitolerans]|uniref:hypothetical protein n=1 Tax=Desulfitibacter alkalitolerans TaxID=264641 RepID=UPI0004892BA6|nr:hypothetical protein [Desulfitibacter alkalitolerans]